MLKSYKAIYNHGNVEWVDEPPDSEYTSILVVVEEPGDVESEKGFMLKNSANGNRLVTLLENWSEESRSATVDKFGDPLLWHNEQRQDRPQPGRGES